MAKKGRRAKNKNEVSDRALLIAYRIRQARADNKYATAKQAAEKFGAGPSHWSHWETAIATPYKSTLEKLATFFGVGIEYFTTEPEDWETRKKDFLLELRGRSRKQKNFYQTADEPSPESGREPTKQEGRHGGDEGLAIFLQIVELLSHARKKVDEGGMDGETYDKQMKIISDMIAISTVGKK